jgi:hypothetical protein
LKLQRIQNISVYTRYKNYKNEICGEKKILKKKLLFYATNNENHIEQICAFGFVEPKHSVFHTEKNG